MEDYTEVFSWGSDHFGQLGLGSKYPGSSFSYPRYCTFNVLIKQVACGEEHSAFISNRGYVYTMGSNNEGRLGINDDSVKYSSTPVLVEALLTQRVIAISCG